MILRSFLFVPADSERKLAKAKTSRADALILDLEDAVAADKRPVARALASEYLQSEKGGGASLWIRINPYGTADCRDDLEAIVAAAPAGIVVPKPETPDVLRTLDKDLSALEAMHGLPPRGIVVMPEMTTICCGLSFLCSHAARNGATPNGAMSMAPEPIASCIGPEPRKRG